MKYIPNYDKDFKPAYYEVTKFLSAAEKPFSLAFERNNGFVYRYDMKITSDIKASYEIVERLVKTVLWVVGGYKIYVAGSSEIAKLLQKDYANGGAREFDAVFMARVYENKFEVIETSFDKLPKEKACHINAGGNFDGCRIGFDAGGSDRKVSAVIDGKCVYSEEVVWFPKITPDPQYHYDEIVKAFKTAASKMPKVDAIGVSSAGIYVDNRIMVASLFLKVPQDKFDTCVKDMYIKAAKEFGNVPLEVANDGDVTALAGAMELNDNQVLGIAMGTSEAAGYINAKGGLSGFLSELAFVPCDFNKKAMVDEWSGDYGCGVKYFSQDGVIKLAKMAGIDIEENLSPAEKLKVVQKLNESGDERARKIFEDIGVYLGYTIAYYSLFYDMKHILLLGRVTSGAGGESILEFAKKVVRDEFPKLKNINIIMPDENNRRVGQSVAAALLPKIK